MFHKFKITTCAFILCLFGLTLMTVSPVFAADEDSPAFKQCQQIKPHGKFGPMKQKKNCFRDLARILSNAANQVTARHDNTPQRSKPIGVQRDVGVTPSWTKPTCPNFLQCDPRHEAPANHENQPMRLQNGNPNYDQ